MINKELNARQWALKQFINDCHNEEIDYEKIKNNFPGVYNGPLDLAKDLIEILKEC